MEPPLTAPVIPLRRLHLDSVGLAFLITDDNTGDEETLHDDIYGDETPHEARHGGSAFFEALL